jgi:putative membrane protein (TIGR04086 family)
MRSISKTANMLKQSNLASDFLIVLKGSVIAVLITLVCFLFFALIMRFMYLDDALIPSVNQVIRIFSIALGGAYVARASRGMGWLKGALTGLLYIVWAFLISWLFSGNLTVNTVLLSDALLGLSAGAIGGIIGVNID